jgi:hypothetical protein
MSAAAEDIITRLKANGVTFELEPYRFHHQSHGQCRSTFLVADGFNPMIEANVDFKKYNEVILDTDTPARSLAKKTLYVFEDNNLSGYGWCLSISDHQDFGARQYLLFTMPPTTENKPKASKGKTI